MGSTFEIKVGVGIGVVVELIVIVPRIESVITGTTTVVSIMIPLTTVVEARDTYAGARGRTSVASSLIVTAGTNSWSDGYP
jgi:hypothetical protein